MKRNEMMVLAGVKPVPIKERFKRKYRKIKLRVMGWMLLGMAIVSGIFSRKAGMYFMGLFWMVAQSED